MGDVYATLTKGAAGIFAAIYTSTVASVSPTLDLWEAVFKVVGSGFGCVVAILMAANLFLDFRRKSKQKG